MSTKGLRRVSSARAHGSVDEAGPSLPLDARRHLQETDEPNQAFLLLWNGGSIAIRHMAQGWVTLPTCIIYLFMGVVSKKISGATPGSLTSISIRIRTHHYFSTHILEELEL